MLTIHTTYDFQRTSGGKTVSLQVSVGVYKGEIPTKEMYYRTTPDQNTDFTKFDKPDFSSLTPEETIIVPYVIPSNLQTTALPADRSGTTPESYTDFDHKLRLIETELDKEGSDVTTAINTLSEKYSSLEFTTD